MKVTVVGTYYILSRKIKEVVNFEADVVVPDGMRKSAVLSYLLRSEDSPLAEHLRKEDKQFHKVAKIKLTKFVETIPADEEVDTIESLGVATVDSDFGDIAEMLSDKAPKSGSKIKKVASDKKG